MEEEKEDFEVSFFLCDSEKTAESLVDEDVYIVPIDEEWNDFGYKIKSLIGLRLDDGSIEWFDAKFAFKDEFDTYKTTQKYLNGNSYIDLFLVDKPFISLFSTEKLYSLFCQIIVHDLAIFILKKLNDISLYNSKNIKVSGWRNFLESEVCSLAMLRNSETYFAFRHAPAILLGRSIESVDSQQPFCIDLHKTKKPITFNFEFDSNNKLRGRIATIIGRNGCGKTTALLELAKGLADRGYEEVSVNSRLDFNQILIFAHTITIETIANDLNRNSSVQLSTLDPQSSYDETWGEESDIQLLVDIAKISARKRPSLRYLYNIIEDEIGICCSIPLQIGILEKLESSIKEKEITLESLIEYNEQRKLEAIAAIDRKSNLIYYDNNNKTYKPSLGQLVFIRFLLNAFAKAGPASVFIIDEPENFLHPNLISQFMRVLNKVLESTQSIAIIATHSPFVIREVQSAQVHIMQKKNSELTIIKPCMQTLGANVSSISNEIFGDDLPKHLYNELVDKIKGNLTFDQILNQYAQEISTEALMILRSRMEKKK